MIYNVSLQSCNTSQNSVNPLKGKGVNWLHIAIQV